MLTAPTGILAPPMSSRAAPRLGLWSLVRALDARRSRCRARPGPGEGVLVRLPTEPLAVSALPAATSRDEYEAARARLLAREKARAREGDAIAAERRRLPMTEIPASVTVAGPKGEIPFLDVFEGRRMLVGYFHMWHDGEPWEGQCIGCTYLASQVQGPLGAPARARRDAGVPLRGQLRGESAVRGLHGLHGAVVLGPRRGRRAAGRPGLRWLGCYLRDDDDRVYRPTGPPTAATRRASGPTACWTAPCSVGRSSGKTPRGLAPGSGGPAPVACRRPPAGAMGRHRRTGWSRRRRYAAMGEGPLHVVFGTGHVGSALAAQLPGSGLAVRAVSRHRPRSLSEGVDWRAADAADPEAAADAAKGAAVIYQCLNAPYTKWPKLFPPLQRAVLAAAERIDALLVSLENLYGYGPTGGAPMTEDLPLAATTSKGRTRAAMTAELLAAATPGGSVSPSGERRTSSAPGVTDGPPSGDGSSATPWPGKRPTSLATRPPPHLQLRPRHRRRPGHPRHRRAGRRPGLAPSRPRNRHHPGGPRSHRRRGRPPGRVRSVPKLVLRALGLVNPVLRPGRDGPTSSTEPFVLDTTKYTDRVR